MYVPLERRIWSVPMTQGYMGNIGGSGSTSAQGGGVPVAQPRRTKPEITYPKKKVSARWCFGLLRDHHRPSQWRW